MTSVLEMGQAAAAAVAAICVCVIIDPSIVAQESCQLLEPYAIFGHDRLLASIKAAQMGGLPHSDRKGRSKL